MADKILIFEEADRIGKVASVDTSKVLIDAEDQDLVTKIGIGNLVAILGATEREYLIGLVERVTRSLRDELIDVGDNVDIVEIGPSPSDLLRVVLIGTYRTVQGDKKHVFKRGADSFPQIDRQCFLIQSGNLQRLMGLLASGLKEHEKLQLGHFVIDPDAEAIASGDKFFQRHASILGSTGSGKSWAVALLLEKASKLSYPNILVLDMHGEYLPLTEEGGFAKGFKIAGPGDLNSDDENIIRLPYWLLNRDEMLSMILDRSDQNAPNQASRFTLHVRNLKKKTLEDNGKGDVIETFTVDSPIPYQLKDLVELLKKDDTDKGVGAKGQPVKGNWEGKLTRFVSRLEAKIEDRRYGFMFKPTDGANEYSWLADLASKLIGSADENSGIKIIDFSEVPSDVLPVVTGTFARLLYDLQFWLNPEKRSPFALVCDEAHIYLPIKNDAGAVEKQALATFERIAKEGRKYGVSLVVVSQRPSDVSRTILSQCNNFLVLRLTNDSDQNVVRKLMPDSMAGLTDMLPLLDTGEALLLGDAILLPTRIKLDKPTLEPASGTLNFWSDWSEKSSDNEAIRLAVETLRRQTRT
ncbi:MAG: ATPase [Gammaproteobacteria bacterium]|nr:MAG: ATPase [Gammaproteobacteria bacterium]